ncbi:unnamed protein product [Allacma fusca]|uniref:Uncharacterized protein n=1 Tax=Allacma fusca TaxID=39272 RepID=A0A8J2LSB3_9HEXA|nr:unnamed protein product [Allacma fusca]
MAKTRVTKDPEERSLSTAKKSTAGIVKTTAKKSTSGFRLSTALKSTSKPIAVRKFPAFVPPGTRQPVFDTSVYSDTGTERTTVRAPRIKRRIKQG